MNKRPYGLNENTVVRDFSVEIHDLEGKYVTICGGSENDLWADFGTLLEGLSFMATNVSRERGQAPNETIDYIVDYLKRATVDYKVID